MEGACARAGHGHSRQIHRSVLTFAVLALLALSPDARADPKRFDLPAGDAGVMLNRFAQQSDIQVLFDFGQLAGERTRAVKGNLEPIDALREMLRGLPVQWTFVNANTVALTVRQGNGAQTDRAAPGVRHGPDRFAIPLPSAAPARFMPLDQVLVAARSEQHETPPTGAPVIRLDRRDIEYSGVATTQELIDTLPQVFGGGPSEDTQIGREAPTNASRGSGINLRGLDAGATLVLIDGERTASSGTTGVFSDVSGIPLSAIDHIDILPDGTSARFGADAIGGVVNFVLRSQFTGAETQLRVAGLGSPAEQRVSQLLGRSWNTVTAMAGLELEHRDALPARDRRQATSNLVPLGGDRFDLPYGYPGTLRVGAQTWAIPASAATGSLRTSDLVPGTVNLYDRWTAADVLPERERWSAFGTLRGTIGTRVDWSADALLTRRTTSQTPVAGFPLQLQVPDTNPFYLNPAGATAPITVLTGSQAYFGAPRAHAQADTGTLGLGATLVLPRGWAVSGRAAYTFENDQEEQAGLFDPAGLAVALADPDPATALDPFRDAAGNNPQTLQAIARTGSFSSRSNLRIASLGGEGDLFGMPAGPARLRLGTEYRDQLFGTRAVSMSVPVPSAQALEPQRERLHRGAAAEFLELDLPLAGPGHSLALLQQLDVSLGARSVQYSDIGHAAVANAALAWSPAAGVTLRGTWSGSFRPPVLPDLTANSFSELITLPDAHSPSGATTVLLAAGTNPGLRAERAHTWTLGAMLNPASLAGASLALTYFDTVYLGRIDSVQLEPDVLNQPDLSWLVARDFTTAERNALCAQTQFSGAASDCVGARIGAIIDNRLRNLEQLQTRGIDAIGRYAFPVASGNLELGLSGTYLLDYSQQKTPGTPPQSLLNTQNSPLNLRLRASLSWQRSAFGASGYINFQNGYRDIASQPNRSVRSWTTFDVQLRYALGTARAGRPSGTEIAISAQNLFNTTPPFLNNPLGVGYDQENADLTGRVVSLDLRERW